MIDAAKDFRAWASQQDAEEFYRDANGRSISLGEFVEDEGMTESEKDSTIKKLEIQIAGLEHHISDLQLENHKLIRTNSELITAMIRASK